MNALRIVESHAVLLTNDDIDTDQIIPARFLKTTEQRGLGEHLFADWRYDSAGAPIPGFALNTPRASTARLLIGGRNFGCGSSREHAPWALSDFGFQVVIATSFADIFRGNALKNGIVPLQLTPDAYAQLLAVVRQYPDAVLRVDIAARSLTGGGHCWSFPLAPFAKHCLLEGVDQMGYLLAASHEIDAFERSHPASIRTSG